MTEDIPKVHKPSADPPSIRFDWREWLPYIAEMDGTDAEKQEYIETLYVIVLGFVDLGFDIKSEPENCGEALDLAAILRAIMVNSSDKPKPAFEAAVSMPQVRRAEGGRS